jgi:hypothetical protein
MNPVAVAAEEVGPSGVGVVFPMEVCAVVVGVVADGEVGAVGDKMIPDLILGVGLIAPGKEMDFQVLSVSASVPHSGSSLTPPMIL